jgi:HK97 family phage prohead protease
MATQQTTDRNRLRRRINAIAPEFLKSEDLRLAAARRLPQGFERRFHNLEIRAEKSDSGKKILKGHAARFGKLSSDLGGFKEILAKSCFARSLRQHPDVLMLRGHEVNKILARCANRTLAIREDDEGLAFEAELADTQIATDTYEEIESGLITGMSFGMAVKQDRWSEIDDCDPAFDDDCDENRGRIPLRTIVDCDLYEISCTPLPAYPQSDVNARAAALWPSGQPAALAGELRTRAMGAVMACMTEEERAMRRRLRLCAARLTL